ncbi:MAG: hypothetical protein HS102_07680 [Planctomycetia bacterium]|nr:hypothetical protein [Planctomycetia bacterium]
MNEKTPPRAFQSERRISRVFGAIEAQAFSGTLPLEDWFVVMVVVSTGVKEAHVYKSSVGVVVTAEFSLVRIRTEAIPHPGWMVVSAGVATRC